MQMSRGRARCLFQTTAFEGSCSSTLACPRPQGLAKYRRQVDLGSWVSSSSGKETTASGGEHPQWQVEEGGENKARTFQMVPP